jgi:hypothetical protein
MVLTGGDGLADKSRAYTKNPNMVVRKIANEIVLVPIKNNVGDLACIYNLNEIGGRIWELIDGATTVEQMRDKIVEEYEVTPEQAEADIIEFLDQLEQEGAVSPSAVQEDTESITTNL